MDACREVKISLISRGFYRCPPNRNVNRFYFHFLSIYQLWCSKRAMFMHKNLIKFQRFFFLHFYSKAINRMLWIWHNKFLSNCQQWIISNFRIEVLQEKHYWRVYKYIHCVLNPIELYWSPLSFNDRHWLPMTSMELQWPLLNPNDPHKAQWPPLSSHDHHWAPLTPIETYWSPLNPMTLNELQWPPLSSTDLQRDPLSPNA